MAAFSMPRWVGAVTMAESAGFLIPVAGFAISAITGLPVGWAWLLMVVCGAGEGALLGVGQAVALRGTSWQVPSARWVPATAVGAMIAWSLGMAPSSLVDLGVDIDLGNPLTWVVAGAGAVALLISIPSAQYVVLRNRIPHAWQWIPVNVVAWTVGLVFTFLPGEFIDESTPGATMAVTFALAGICMAATVAVVTGLWLRSRPVLAEPTMQS